MTANSIARRVWFIMDGLSQFRTYTRILFPNSAFFVRSPIYHCHSKCCQTSLAPPTEPEQFLPSLFLDLFVYMYILANTIIAKTSFFNYYASQLVVVMNAPHHVQACFERSTNLWPLGCADSDYRSCRRFPCWQSSIIGCFFYPR